MIQYITLRVNAHSTEDRSRVDQALDFFLQNIDSDKEKLVETIYAEGHYGNPIIIYNVQISQKSKCRSFISFLKREIKLNDLEKLRSEISLRLDEDQSFHMKFDKQAAYQGKLELSSSSDAVTVKMKITTFPKNWDDARRFMEEVLE